MFKKILIANRGEIAVRVIRACRELGVQTVAVFSEIDREALHVRWADEAYPIGPPPAKESYLRIEKILKVAERAGAEAIHPGYGFLSENAEFSDACEKVGIKFIGPQGDSMRKLGDKILARKTAEKIGVPTVPGVNEPIPSAEEAKRLAEKFKYPVLLKARAGGGGKGMRKVTETKEMESAFRLASSEAGQSFGDPALFLEKYVEEPHHVEVQILGDAKGKVAALGERECSAQRRHQKIVEESPSPFISEATRKKLLEAATALAEEARYENAGTMEFLVDKNQNIYFLEMNARLQVEHPVTETVTGIDLVRAQVRISAGESLAQVLSSGGGPGQAADFTAASPGHALECRIYAEDPDQGFLPSPGRVERVRNPEGPGVRVDAAVFDGMTISVFYDPMIAKLITWGRDRAEAIERMERALREYQVVGVKTNIGFLEAVLSHTAFRQGRYDTGFVERELTNLKRSVHQGDEEVAAIAALIAHRGGRAARPAAPVADVGERHSPWLLMARREGLRS